MPSKSLARETPVRSTRARTSVLIVAVGVLAAVLDYASGPAVQFPILFVLPVLLAAGRGNSWWALAMAVALPLARLGFDLHWDLPMSASLLALNAVVRMFVLVVAGMTVSRLVQTRREVQTLKGIIPVCASCKKIRDLDGNWDEMESYIGKRSEAEFSHGLCPDCLSRYYGKEQAGES